jgi:hypothetical protein
MVEDKKICPLMILAVHGKPGERFCVKEKCQWWTTLTGKNKDTGQGIRTEECAVVLLAIATTLRH